VPLSLKEKTLTITVAARTSPLSRVQVKEIETELKKHQSHVEFSPLWLISTGDQDLKTSLRDLGKTDFFSKEVDGALLADCCDIAVHSAKDLPEPLTPGLTLIALTVGKDPRDSLVFREEQSIETLPSGAVVGCSSERREEMIKKLRPDLIFKDIRGTIHHRLEQVQSGEFDAVVIAEAALIRLELTHLPRHILDDPTTEHQGQLAVLARSENSEMESLFSCIDCRQNEKSS
jgi:hydroxymethylbilane synthase